MDVGGAANVTVIDEVAAVVACIDEVAAIGQGGCRTYIYIYIYPPPCIRHQWSDCEEF